MALLASSPSLCRACGKTREGQQAARWSSSWAGAASFASRRTGYGGARPPPVVPSSMATSAASLASTRRRTTSTTSRRCPRRPPQRATDAHDDHGETRKARSRRKWSHQRSSTRLTARGGAEGNEECPVWLNLHLLAMEESEDGLQHKDGLQHEQGDQQVALPSAKALLGKNLCFRERDLRTNLCITVFPILLYMMRGTIGRKIDKPNYFCGCTSGHASTTERMAAGRQSAASSNPL